MDPILTRAGRLEGQLANPNLGNPHWNLNRFWRSGRIAGLRAEGNVVGEQCRYDEAERKACRDLSAACCAGERKGRSRNALPEHLARSVTLGLCITGASRIIYRGIARGRLRGLLQAGLHPEQSPELYNPEEHQQKHRQQQRELDGGIAAAFVAHENAR